MRGYSTSHNEISELNPKDRTALEAGSGELYANVLEVTTAFCDEYCWLYANFHVARYGEKGAKEGGGGLT